MKVAWLSHRDLTHTRAGGVERTIDEVSRRLAEEGVEVDWLSVAERPEEVGTSFDGVGHVRVAANAISTHALVPGRVAAGSYDVVVEDLGHVVPWGTHWFSGRPTIAYFHHLHRRTLSGQVPLVEAIALSAVEYTYPLVYRNQRFVTGCKSALEDLESIGVARSTVSLIPPGVDLDLFHPGPKSATPTAVYIGGLKWYKRPDLAIRTFNLVLQSEPDASLTVIGTGPCLRETQALTERLGISDHVRFVGRLSKEALSEHLGKAWVNLHTSVAEGWCLSAMEAAASGVPTVACRVPGLIDSLLEGESGTLVDGASPRRLAEATVDILRGPERWVATCRRHSLRFSWVETTRLWRAELDRAIRSQTYDA